LPPLELGSTRRGRAVAGGVALMVCCFVVAAEEKLPAPLFSELARSS